MTVPAAARPETAPFLVLTVCTGNICRSPFAEHALRAALAPVRPGTGLAVASAGTGAVIGAGATPETEAQALLAGFSTAGHAARQLDRGVASGAGLVLGLTREHRRDSVLTWPRANRIAFTLTEFARLADTVSDFDVAGLDEQTPTALVELVARRRGGVSAVRPELDDIDDPFRQGPEVYEAMRVRTLAATASIAALFARLRA